jgi:hypothetical protein
VLALRSRVWQLDTIDKIGPALLVVPNTRFLIRQVQLDLTRSRQLRTASRWDRTDRGGASAGFKPVAHVSWLQTRGPRQLASNPWPTSDGFKPVAHVSWLQTRGPGQLEANWRRGWLDGFL